MEQASSAADLRYPIGKFDWPSEVTPARRSACIGEIATLPWELRAVVERLDEAQLDTPYRPEGWTVRQTVHHLADSHMNAFIRFKLALTEEQPTIKPYAESAWAETADARTARVVLSLQLLEALHARWALLLESLDDAAFTRTFRHPELGLVRLDINAALYAWHGRHHLTQITGLCNRMGWK